MKAFKSNVTSPEPFSFTSRDEEKRSKKKRRKLSDSNAASTCFHSNNVPTHVLLPVYQLIAEHSEMLKKDRVGNEMKNLLTQVSSFRLSCSSKSRSTNQHQSEFSSNQDTDIIKFKATPYPSHLFHKEKINQETIEEQLRHIRIKARAEEMIKHSSLPFTRSQDIHHENSFLPVRKEMAVSTRIKKHDYIDTVSNLQQNFVRQNKFIDRQPNLKKLCTMNSICFVHPKVTGKPASFGHTKTSQLRLVNRRKENERTAKEKEQTLVAHSRQKTLQMQLQKEVVLKVKMLNQLSCSEDVIRQKLLSYRQSQQSRLEEYQLGLQEMRQRLGKRPLLIEQQSQKACKDAALKRIQSRKASLLSVETSTSSDVQSQESHPDVDRIESSDDEVDEPSNVASQ